MGRPRKLNLEDGSCGQSKQDCVLAAAREVFLEMGYAAASMDAVAARANVSKATIYAYFDGKRALFEHIIRSRCREMKRALDLPDEIADRRQALRELASRAMAFSMSPESVAIHRVVAAEAPRLPELGEAFYAAGMDPALAGFTRMFAELTGRGLLAVPEAEAPLLAELFVNMLRGDAHSRALLGMPQRRKDHGPMLDLAVDLVLARYATRQPAPNPQPAVP
jgi:TetR/AcrR family transcriptional repressor of mexJK operon